MLLYQPRGPDGVPAGQHACRIASSASRCRSYQAPRSVQVRHLIRLFLPEAGVEQVGEQMMVAPPAAHLIQRDQEQIGPLHLLQQALAPVCPVTASHSSPDSRSSTEVSQQEAANLAGWRSSTSSVRKSRT